MLEMAFVISVCQIVRLCRLPDTHKEWLRGLPDTHKEWLRGTFPGLLLDFS